MPPAPRFRSQRTLAPQAQPPGLYHSTYDPERGAAICRRIAAGESLRSICRADLAMPTEKTVWNWARAQPGFRDMKAHALGLARAASLAAQAERDRAKARATGSGRKAWNAGQCGYSEAVVSPILTRLMMGERLDVICADPELPAVATVYLWLRKFPDFLAQYRRVKAMAPEVMLELACEDLPWMGERKSWPMLGRTVRATDRASARLALKRYAPAAGPADVRVILVDADGSRRVIYGAEGQDAAARPPGI